MFGFIGFDRTFPSVLQGEKIGGLHRQATPDWTAERRGEGVVGQILEGAGGDGVGGVTTDQEDLLTWKAD